MNKKDDDLPLHCLKQILLPVMRFCLRRSLKLQEIIEACKESLVEAAEAEIEFLGERNTVNRVSIMTGIHRADVLRLSGGEEEKPGKTTSNIINRLIAQWQTDERFLTASGRPRILSFDGKQGEFADLIHSISTDPNPYTILFELERTGAVENTPRGVRLKTREYIVSSDVKQSFEHLSQDSDDLIAAVEENVFLAQDEPNLHLRTEYDNISPKSLAEIRRWLLKEGSTFHSRLRRFLARFDRDMNTRIRDQGPGIRVSICSFSRTESKILEDESSNSKSVRGGEGI